MNEIVPRLLFLLFLISASSAQTCHFLNKAIATDDVPCNTTADISICCNKNDICLSNGLCYIQGSNGPSFSRGSCTDENWNGVCASAQPCGMSMHIRYAFMRASSYEYGAYMKVIISKL